MPVPPPIRPYCSRMIRRKAPVAGQKAASGISKSSVPLLRLVLANRRDRLRVVAIAVSATVGSSLEAVVLVLITLLGFRLSGSGSDPINLPFGLPLDEFSTGRLLLLGTGGLLARLIAGFANVWFTAHLSESILARWRRRIVAGFLGTSWERQRGEQDGHLQTVAQTYVSNLADLANQLATALTALVSFSIFVAGAFALDPRAALALFVFGLLISLALRPLTARVRRLARLARNEGQEYARMLGELAHSANEVRVFGREIEVEDRLTERLSRQTSANRQQAVTRGATTQLLQTAGLAVVLLGLGIASQMKLSDAALVGALVLLLIRSLGYGQTLQSTYQAIAGSQPFVQAVVEVVQAYDADRPTFGDRRPESLTSLRIVDATFGYAGVPVLEHVDLEIRAGESFGIVGPSGAGKSTLAAALLDLVRPLSGRIMVDGIDVSDVSRESWTRMVAFVPQEPQLIEGSVADNIDFYRNYDDAQIEKAAKLAHLANELLDWSEGIRHLIGPRGVRLSGGQKQRICVARALLGTPELLIMDEPTSALDGDTEGAITDVLEELRGTCTMVIIAHRLSTLEFCDRVFHVADGRVIEIGTGADVQQKQDVRRLVQIALADEAG